MCAFSSRTSPISSVWPEPEEDGLEQIVQSGRIADIILMIMLAEAVVLLYLWRNETLSSRVGIIGNLIAGASLVLAMRMALQEASWLAIAGCLLLALAGHLIDLAGRLRVMR